MKTKLKPGVYTREELPIPYEDIDAVNFSTLKHMGESPKHYLNALRFGGVDKPAMRKGRANHCATLEPDVFAKTYTIWDSTYKEEHGELQSDGVTLLVGKDKKRLGAGRPRSGKLWEAFSEKCKSSGVEVISEAEFDSAIAVQQSVHGDPECGRLLSTGEPEVTLVWEDEITGILCKGRVDWLTKVDGFVAMLDLKGTSKIGAFELTKQFWNMFYHVQQSFYSDAYRILTGETPLVGVIAHEMEAPHDVVPYWLSGDYLMHGRATYKAWLARLHECRTKDEWPGHAQNAPDELPLPRWVS